MYYPQNPRIMSDIEKIKEKNPDAIIDQNTIDRLMWERDATHTLFQTIKKDGGLNEALLVYNNYVIEGNTRLCCLKKLSKEDEKWKEVPCEVIIDEISSLQINRLLIDKHVTGKNEWSAYDKSLLYYRLKHEDNYSVKDIAELGHESPTKVYQRIAAIELYKESKCSDIKKYSHFEQFISNNEINKIVKDDPKNQEAAVSQILNGKKPTAQDIRSIPTICRDKDSKKRFIRGNEPITEIVLDLEQQKKLQNKALINVVRDLSEKIQKLNEEDIQCLKNNNSDKAQINKLLKDLVKLAEYADIKLPGKLQTK